MYNVSILATSQSAFLLYDLKWADPASRLLLASMISNTKEITYVFFACCYRDDDVQEGDQFTLWLSSISAFPLEKIVLQNIAMEGVNELVSETLHLSPRLTRPLASILHHKTRGNPVSPALLFCIICFPSFPNMPFQFSPCF